MPYTMTEGDGMYSKVGTSRILPNEIAQHIISLIEEKKLMPGDKLPGELLLAKQFGVSRPTIREAIRSLASNNIVVVGRGKGTFVSATPGLSSDPLGLKFIKDKNILINMLEARLLMEPGTAKLAALRASPEDIASLDACIVRMETREFDQKTSLEDDVFFHIGIAEATKNPIIERLIPIIVESNTIMYRETVKEAKHHFFAVAAHRRIFEAISAHDAERAFAEMKRHIEDTLIETRDIRMRGNGSSDLHANQPETPLPARS